MLIFHNKVSTTTTRTLLFSCSRELQVHIENLTIYYKLKIQDRSNMFSSNRNIKCVVNNMSPAENEFNESHRKTTEIVFFLILLYLTTCTAFYKLFLMDITVARAYINKHLLMK